VSALFPTCRIHGKNSAKAALLPSAGASPTNGKPFLMKNELLHNVDDKQDLIDYEFSIKESVGYRRKAGYCPQVPHNVEFFSCGHEAVAVTVT
jgi:hypothetical protein